MLRYYTRVCNFYYGQQSKILVKNKKSLPLHNIKEISFDQIEIITRNSKKKIFIIKKNITLNLHFTIGTGRIFYQMKKKNGQDFVKREGSG